MDQNKLQKLKDIGYTIPKTCGTCRHFQMHVDEHFGECSKHEYVHLKHSGGKRKLSVVMHGSCSDHEVGDLSYLHGFVEFLPDRITSEGDVVIGGKVIGKRG